MLRYKKRLSDFLQERLGKKALVPLSLLLLVLTGLFIVLRPDPSATELQARSFDLEIRNGAVTPDEITVGEGDKVTFRVSAYRPTKLHLHGYDIEREIEPDETVDISFEATLTGRFENHVAHTDESGHAEEDDHADEATGTLIVEPR